MGGCVGGSGEVSGCRWTQTHGAAGGLGGFAAGSPQYLEGGGGAQTWEGRQASSQNPPEIKVKSWSQVLSPFWPQGGQGGRSEPSGPKPWAKVFPAAPGSSLPTPNSSSLSARMSQPVPRPNSPNSEGLLFH